MPKFSGAEQVKSKDHPDQRRNIEYFKKKFDENYPKHPEMSFTVDSGGYSVAVSVSMRKSTWGNWGYPIATHQNHSSFLKECDQAVKSINECIIKFEE